MGGRVNLFPKVRVGHQSRHPVYVLEQSNEAFYFRLDEALVRTWLARPEMGCADGALLDNYPELICLTTNKYLSRSTLIGRQGRPDFMVNRLGVRLRK
jgi:hypothetical protein